MRLRDCRSGFRAWGFRILYPSGQSLEEEVMGQLTVPCLFFSACFALEVTSGIAMRCVSPLQCKVLGPIPSSQYECDAHASMPTLASWNGAALSFQVILEASLGVEGGAEDWSGHCNAGEVTSSPTSPKQTRPNMLHWTPGRLRQQRGM